MPALTRDFLRQRLSGAVHLLRVAALVCFTAFAGFCFVTGMAFILVVLVVTVVTAFHGFVWGGVLWIFFPTFAFLFEYVSWRLFWFGLTTLRGDRPTETEVIAKRD